MSFKENLKKKISIDSLTETAVRSVGTPGMSNKVDKNAVRELLALSPFIMEKRRDLELYFLEVEGGTGERVRSSCWITSFPFTRILLLTM